MENDLAQLVREKLTGLDAFMSETSKELTTINERTTKALELAVSLRNGIGTGQLADATSLGELVTKSAELKQFVAGRVRGAARVTIPGRIPALMMKTVITTGANLRPGVQGAPIGGLPQAPLPLTLGDLLPQTPLTEGYLQATRQTGVHPVAAIQVTEGSAKQEGVIDFATVSLIPETIAVWIPVSRQAAADIAGLTDLINSELLYAVKTLEESQILNGTSTFAVPVQGQLLGLNTNAAAIVSTSTTPLDAIADLIGALLASGVMPTGLVVNPGDWLSIAKAKNANEEYLLGSPAAAPGRVLWSVPMAVSMAQPAGTVLAGDFQRGARLWYREDASVEVSSEHSDFFVKNLLAVRCEERVVLNITHPAYFAKVALPTGV